MVLWWFNFDPYPNVGISRPPVVLVSPFHGEGCPSKVKSQDGCLGNPPGVWVDMFRVRCRGGRPPGVWVDMFRVRCHGGRPPARLRALIQVLTPGIPLVCNFPYTCSCGLLPTLESGWSWPKAMGSWTVFK